MKCSPILRKYFITFIEILSKITTSFCRYKENALRISALIKDKQVKQTDKATYWIEYIIRHKGAPHMKTPAHYLNWYQYHSLDVIAFLLLLILVALKITCVIFKKLFCKKKEQKQKLN